MTETIFRKHTNARGTAFGGNILAWEEWPPPSPPRATARDDSSKFEGRASMRMFVPFVRL